MNHRSKSALFLIEQVVVIAVFAICAAVCVFIMAFAFQITDTAVNSRNALLAAENAAESFKAFNGDVNLTAEFLGAGSNNNQIIVYYNEDWQVLTYGEAAFVMEILISEENITFAAISVTCITTNEVLINLTTGARRTRA